MITCPNCHQQELSGALFCSECGAQLRDYGKAPTQPFQIRPAETLPEKETYDSARIPRTPVETVDQTKKDIVSLFIVDAKHAIKLSGRSEYTLGRTSEDQPIIPDIDLTDFEAYVMGVSRLHAVIKLGQQRVSIRDLGSANGTRVNGERIIPNVDFPIKHGDSIALGKLMIQVIISTP